MCQLNISEVGTRGNMKIKIVTVTSLSNGGDGESWEPTMEGFLKYLVDSKLIFGTIEHIVDESSDVSYVYFRKTGLDRSNGLSKDLEWLRLQGNVIPRPSYPGTMYARYLKELAEKSRPMFLCHFYHIYFSHIAGGQVIAKQAGIKTQSYHGFHRSEEQMPEGSNQNFSFPGADITVDHFVNQVFLGNPGIRESSKSVCNVSGSLLVGIST